MPSRSTRIAYLKRMLRRLDGEDLRIQQHDLSPEGKEQCINLLGKSRAELREELERLERVGGGVSLS
jgi:hypothetical protein